LRYISLERKNQGSVYDASVVQKIVASVSKKENRVN
jgi:hypothetical protein